MKNKKILVVEDDSRMLAIILSQLRDFDLKGFDCPRMALKWLDNNEVDLIISDFSMPLMNGHEFLTTATTHVGPKIIFSSGYGHDCSNYFWVEKSKPKQLRQLVDRLLT